jgi:hypothetical protein
MLVKYSQSVCAQALDSSGAALAPLGRNARRQGELGAGLRRGRRGEKKLMKQRAVPPLIFCLAAVLALAATVPVRAHAQTPPWTGIIAPSRAIDWSQAGVPGGIPVRTTVCASIAPEGSASAPVAPADVNAAIAGCPAGEVVYLQPGNFYFSSGIDFADHSNVTLRGAGADQTFLYFYGDASCYGMQGDVCIENGTNTWGGNGATVGNWTAGYAPGTTQITLDNTSGIVPGRTLLILDQLNDSNTDNGGLWINDTNGVAEDDNPSNGYRPGRAQGQVVLATAVSGSTVTISPGIYMPNWSSSQSPQAWWSTPAVTGDGVEDLSMDNSHSNGNAIVVDSGYGDWVNGVRSYQEGSIQHVLVYQSAHCTIQSSYFYGTPNAITESYGYDEVMSSDDLIANNIFQHIASPVVVDGSSSGTVAAYNYALDDYFGGASSNWMAIAFEPHSAGIDYELFEGNVGDGFGADDIHGTGNLWTLFRNRLYGFDPPDPLRTNDTIAVTVDSFHRFMNVVGNVLGDSGVTTTYQIVAPAGGNQDMVDEVYNLGWSNWAGWPTQDPLTPSTLFRWGNYDVVHNAAEWNPLEVPSSLSALANPVPTTETLPASFFLSSKPAWWITPWGTPPWPAIGPDVTGGTDASANGHANAIPAQLCYENSPNDQNYPQDQSGLYVKLFNAGSCYGQPPAAPTGLTAAVQ